MADTNKLEIVVKESGLEVTQADTILASFQKFFQEASGYEKRAKEIVVTNISQVAEMKEARTLRLALRDIRLDAEKVRVALKEDSLRKSRAIDGIANVIKALIVPLEQHLEQQEKFAEIWAEAKKQEKLNQRITILSPIVEDVSMYNLADMSQEAFDKLVENAKQAKDAKAEAERKAEEERLKKIEEGRIENERIRAENEKLKKEKEEKDKKDEEAKKKLEAEQKKIEEEHQKQLEKERADKKKLEDEIKANQKKEQERLEAEKKANDERILAEKKAHDEMIEKERQEKLAPEKEKLFKYSEQIKAIQCPDGLSKAGLEIVKGVEAKLLAISQEIKVSIKNL